jgi:hypothetical protein
MKTLLALLLATLCAATAYSQTIKTLSYNSTNNTVVATQRVTFSALGLATGSAAAPSLTYAIGTNVFGTFATTQLGIGPYLGFSVNGTRQFYIATNTIRAELPISFSTTTNAAETRTNLSLGLPALTNTSNVTTMRALAGSTNTNQPYSGTIEYLDHGNLTWVMVVSNGIIIANYEQ